MRRRALGLLLALAWMPAVATEAQTLRVPAEGVPALTVDVPAGWAVNPAGPNGAFLVGPGQRTILLLTMLVESEVADATLAEIAAKALKATNAEPYSAREPGQVAGRPGEAFASRVSNDKGMQAKVVLTLARLSPVRVAAVLATTVEGATAEQIAGLEALVRQVRLAGVN